MLVSAAYAEGMIIIIRLRKELKAVFGRLRNTAGIYRLTGRLKYQDGQYKMDGNEEAFNENFGGSQKRKLVNLGEEQA